MKRLLGLLLVMVGVGGGDEGPPAGDDVPTANYGTTTVRAAVAAEHSFNVAERFSRGRIAGASVLCRQFIRE